MTSYPKSAYLLMLPPTQQDLSNGNDAVFYLVGSPNRQWKIGPNRDWFIALQDEPRTTAQLAGEPTAQDIAQADYVDFFDSNNRTLKYRVKADGSAYVQYGGGGGGSGTYAGLSDAGTVNLPQVNAPLGAVLTQLPINTQTANGGYTLAASDAGGQVDMNYATANQCTVPLNAVVPIPLYSVFTVRQAGVGATTINLSAGITSQVSSARSLTISGQWETATLQKTAMPDTWSVACN